MSEDELRAGALLWAMSDASHMGPANDPPSMHRIAGAIVEELRLTWKMSVDCELTEGFEDVGQVLATLLTAAGVEP